MAEVWLLLPGHMLAGDRGLHLMAEEAKERSAILQDDQQELHVGRDQYPAVRSGDHESQTPQKNSPLQDAEETTIATGRWYVST